MLFFSLAILKQIMNVNNNNYYYYTSREFPYKTSIDERLIFYNITRCFAIAAGDIIKYQGGHMMRNADARTVRSRQETFNSNGGHDA